MSEALMTPDPSPAGVKPGPRLGTAVLIATVVVAVPGLLVSVIQVDNVLNGRIRDRTPLGLTLMALGFLGPVVALIALRRRDALRRKGLREWPSLALFPGAFPVLWGAAWVAYGALGTVGRPVIPHTPGLVIRFDPEGRPSLRGEGELGLRGWTGRPVGWPFAPDSPFEFQIHPNEFGEGATTFAGSATRTEGGRVEVRGELVLGTSARFRVEGLGGAVLVVNDQPREFPVLLEPGTYRIAVRGTAGG